MGDTDSLRTFLSWWSGGGEWEGNGFDPFAGFTALWENLGEIRGKYGKVKKLGKTRETQGNLWENQKTQRKLSENFQLFDTAAVFSS